MEGFCEWVAAAGFKEVLLLTSAQAYKRVDTQLKHGGKLFLSQLSNLKFETINDLLHMRNAKIVLNTLSLSPTQEATKDTHAQWISEGEGAEEWACQGGEESTAWRR